MAKYMVYLTDSKQLEVEAESLDVVEGAVRFSDADGKSVLVVPLAQLRATGRVSHVDLDGS